VLERNRWLCGERFTAADVSVGFALHFARTLHLQDGFKPQVLDYLERVEQRDAFARAVRKESE
jgi:glutathione S-transferase